jgi:hypothetical protein
MATERQVSGTELGHSLLTLTHTVISHPDLHPSLLRTSSLAVDSITGHSQTARHYPPHIRPAPTVRPTSRLADRLPTACAVGAGEPFARHARAALAQPAPRPGAYRPRYLYALQELRSSFLVPALPRRPPRSGSVAVEHVGSFVFGRASGTLPVGRSVCQGRELLGYLRRRDRLADSGRVRHE